MRRFLVSGLLVGVLAVPRPAVAWGFEAHKFVVARAIALLPPEIRPFFEKYRETVVEHTIDPDLWRTAGWEAESPKHYVDMDAYGPYPFQALPHEYDEAVKRYGREFVEKNGLLPWRTQEMYGKLVDAFAQKGPYWRENVKFFSAVIAHYISDAHVPFHATLNHDGQLTAQWGIHARFEADLFELYRDRLTIAPQPIRAVANVRELVFTVLTASFTSVQPILDADKAAVAGRDFYDEEYFARLFAKVRPILELRLSESITNAASVITQAWIDAGRPVLPLDQPRVPRKVQSTGRRGGD